MISEYKDMLEKARFYKKQVIQSFIKQGYFPSDEEIQTALSDIDMRSALLDTYLSAKGSLFNTKEINFMFECIYKDLNILYTVLEDILLNEYNKLKLDVEAQVTELEQKVYNLKCRMNEEINSTTLGTTIFFKANNWESETNDDITTITLGELDLINGSEIALFANINNIEADSVYFKLESETDTMYALPYNYNNDVYTIPGKLGINRFAFNISKDLKVNGNIEISLNDLDYRNEYKILGGQNLMKVTYKDSNIVSYEPFASFDRPFSTDKDCYIEFYMIDNSSITYDFNIAPNHTNFALNDGTIVSNKTITKVFIDAPSGFVCRFRLDKGEIWGSCIDGIIQNNNTLLYAGDWTLKDFQILEIVKSELTKYKISLILKSDKTIINYINNVYIKEVD